MMAVKPTGSIRGECPWWNGGPMERSRVERQQPREEGMSQWNRILLLWAQDRLSTYSALSRHAREAFPGAVDHGSGPYGCIISREPGHAGQQDERE